MEAFLSIVALFAVITVSCLIRAHYELKKGRAIANAWWLRIATLQAQADQMSMRDKLSHANIDYDRWRDCMAVFSVPMFIEESLKSIGTLSKEATSEFELYLRCCVDKMRHERKDLSLIKKSHEALGDIYADELSYAEKYRKFTQAFASLLGCQENAEIVTSTVKLLGCEFHCPWA